MTVYTYVRLVFVSLFSEKDLKFLCFEFLSFCVFSSQFLFCILYDRTTSQRLTRVDISNVHVIRVSCKNLLYRSFFFSQNSFKKTNIYRDLYIFRYMWEGKQCMMTEKHKIFDGFCNFHPSIFVFFVFRFPDIHKPKPFLKRNKGLFSTRHHTHTHNHILCLGLGYINVNNNTDTNILCIYLYDFSWNVSWFNKCTWYVPLLTHKNRTIKTKSVNDLICCAHECCCISYSNDMTQRDTCYHSGFR